MASNFHISIQRKSRNLYLKLMGDFDGSSAFELLQLLKSNGQRISRAIIDTSRLRQIHPFGQAVFQNNLFMLNDTSIRLVLTGENAAHLAPKFGKLL